MIISIIVAISDNNVIGCGNKLPWHVAEDMKWFRERTAGKTVIMGRKTHESIGRKLPGRKNIVITSNINYSASSPDILLALSPKEALNCCNEDEEIFIIGGEKIYKEFFPLANKLYLTKVFGSFPGDAFFNEINQKEWNLEYIRTEKECEFKIFSRV